MATDPFCRRMDRDICSPFEWPEKITSHTEGVVDHDAYSFAAGHFHDRLIIRNIECRIAEIFKEYCLCTAVCQCFKVFHAVACCKTHFYSHVAKSDCEHSEGTSVEVRLGNDVVPGTADVCDRQKYSRLTGCCRNCRHTSFESSHSLFEYLGSRVGNTCIYVSGTFQFEKFGTVLHVVKSICGALIYRYCCSF